MNIPSIFFTEKGLRIDNSLHTGTQNFILTCIALCRWNYFKLHFKIAILNCFKTFFSLSDSNILKSHISGNTSNVSHLRQKRQEMEPYFPEYPDAVDFSDYPEQSPNYLAPMGIAGGAGLALKAAKTKAKLKGLKLLAVPAGIALLGGIAALASGVIPPAVIGGINLPFQVNLYISLTYSKRDKKKLSIKCKIQFIRRNC